jgi:hypothetical protein
MRQDDFSRPGAAARALSLLICALLIMAAAGFAPAQSGRKVPRRPSSPDPLPPKPSEPPIEEAKPKDDKPQTTILVSFDRDNLSSSSHWIGTVVQECMGRLKDSRAVTVTAGREMNRKQASDTAKATTDTYVVWIELQVDPAYRGRMNTGYTDPRYLYVSYTLFSPGTGKTKSSGNVYPYNRAVGGIPLPGRIPNSSASAEYALRQAGRDTADRVLENLNLPRPPDKPF